MVLYYLVQVMKEYWPLIGCQRSGDSVPTCNGPLLPCTGNEYWPLIGCQRSGDSVPTCNGSLLPCTGNEGVLASDWLSKVR